MERANTPRDAVLLRLPAALPALPVSEPFPPGTTPKSVLRQLDAVDRSLQHFKALAERLAAAAPQAGAGLGGDAREAAEREWFAQHVQPLIDVGWSEGCPWCNQLYGLSTAVKNIAEHLPEWQGAAARVEQVASLHATVGALLTTCATALRTPWTQGSAGPDDNRDVEPSR